MIWTPWNRSMALERPMKASHDARKWHCDILAHTRRGAFLRWLTFLHFFSANLALRITWVGKFQQFCICKIWPLYHGPWTLPQPKLPRFWNGKRFYQSRGGRGGGQILRKIRQNYYSDNEFIFILKCVCSISYSWIMSRRTNH